jgi:galactokinase
MSKIIVRAPARINIIGEHTDYNGGFVLPTTTALYTRLTATARSDRIVEVTSKNVDDTRSFRLDDLRPDDEVSWIAYVKGVAAELQAEGLTLQGANIEIDSGIPLGGGLSSSASLELGVATALLGIAGESVPSPRLARLCQKAEHNFAGVRCGIMDQYTIACAEKGHAVLLDCRSADATQVPIPDGMRFIVTDSGVRHRLPDGEYNSRADECQAAVRLLAKVVPGLTSLRDLNAATLARRQELIGSVLYRRCRHVVNENTRVHKAVTALKEKDMQGLGSLISASHRSLRDDFEVSCAEVETLVEISNRSYGVLGSRMVGAGFGGCVLSLVDAKDVADTCSRISKDYKAAFGREPWMHVVQAADPVGELSAR